MNIEVVNGEGVANAVHHERYVGLAVGHFEELLDVLSTGDHINQPCHVHVVPSQSQAVEDVLLPSRMEPLPQKIVVWPMGGQFIEVGVEF